MSDRPTEVFPVTPGAPAPAPALNSFQLGSVLAERYRIEARIGQGGMGIVFRAHDLQAERTVAIKALFVPGGMPDEVQRFQREFRALARMQHPHVIAVHDYGQSEGVPYYVMEYIAGRDLHHLRRDSGGTLTSAFVQGLLGQICQALAYVHAQGIVHRDIKPSNFMLLENAAQPESFVKLMDFGLAQLSDVSGHITQSGTLLGTVFYMAPEQAQGLPVDRRADLYALGAVLYELLSGRPPFIGETPVNVIMQHITQTPAPLRSLMPDVPLVLDAVITRLLAKQAAQRFSTAEEVWNALRDPAASAALTLMQPAPGTHAHADIVFRAGLVGRTRELDLLNRALDEAWTGHARFVLVEGEAGVGKSRLTAELAGQARLRGGRKLSGACFENENLPYSPVIAALQDILSYSVEQNLSELVDGLEPELVRLMPQNPLFSGAVPAPEIDPGQARLRLFDALTQVVVRLAARYPLLLVIEDVHWADAATLELLHYMVRNTANARVLVLGTSRREERSAEHPLSTLVQGLKREKRLDLLELTRLTPEDTAQLLASLLALENPPEQLVVRIYQESEGNPFFVEEVLKGLVEEGVLVRQANGMWHLGTAMVTRMIPASVADVVRRRLAQVEGLARQAIECAAVIGREFAFNVLKLALNADEDALLDALDALLRARLLEEARALREDRYRFAHAKLQEVAYEELSAPRRRKLHRAVAAAFERAYPTRREAFDVAGPLAHHYAAGGDLVRGLLYGRRAGDLARTIYANAEALSYYRNALALVTDDLPDEQVDEVIAIQIGLGEVCHLVGEYDAALAAFQTVLTLLPRSPRPPAEHAVAAADAWRRLGNVREVQGRYDEALKCLQRGFAELGEDQLYPLAAALLYKDTAWVLFRQGQYDAALSACQIGWNLAQQAQADEVLADIEDYLGVAWAYKDDYEQALIHHRACLTSREARQDKSGMAKAYNNIGHALWMQGLLPDAREAYQRSLDLCATMGHRLGMAMVLNNIGNVYAEEGRHEDSVTYYQRTREICQQIGNLFGVSLAYNNLGDAYLKLGLLEPALEYLQLAVTLRADVGDRPGQSSTYTSIARVHLQQGQLTEAIDNATRAYALAEELGARLHLADAAHVLGRTYKQLHDIERAQHYLDMAKQIFLELGQLQSVVEIERDL